MSKRHYAKAAGTLALIGLFALVLLVWYGTRVPASASASALDAALVQRGEYVAQGSDCVACHSLPDGPPFARGLAIAEPLGTIYATNITPDRAAGIGHYSLADFDRAVRHGVAPGGCRLYPAIPYPIVRQADRRGCGPYMPSSCRASARPQNPTNRAEFPGR